MIKTFFAKIIKYCGFPNFSCQLLRNKEKINSRPIVPYCAIGLIREIGKVRRQMSIRVQEIEPYHCIRQPVRASMAWNGVHPKNIRINVSR